jgi:serine/threonine protein kinase
MWYLWTVVVEVTIGGTTCVGKLMHKSLIDKEADIKKQSKPFSSACELLSKPQFCHPNIVPLMGLCMFDENVHTVLVMERVDESCESIVMSFKSVIPLPLILHVVKDVTKGLIFMHNYDPPIVHHNLTARNVLVSKTIMIAKIADIGDSLIAYPETFLDTLLRSHAIVPYMPPEVLYRKPNHSCMLDMFSFGHLVLTSTIQKFPLAKDLKEATYIDVETRESKARSEVERREEFLKMLYSKLTRDHKLTQMVLQCLHDMPGKRYLVNFACMFIIIIVPPIFPGID